MIRCWKGILLFWLISCSGLILSKSTKWAIPSDGTFTILKKFVDWIFKHCSPSLLTSSSLVGCCLLGKGEPSYRSANCISPFTLKFNWQKAISIKFTSISKGLIKLLAHFLLILYIIVQAHVKKLVQIIRVLHFRPSFAISGLVDWSTFVGPATCCLQSDDELSDHGRRCSKNQRFSAESHVLDQLSSNQLAPAACNNSTFNCLFHQSEHFNT